MLTLQKKAEFCKLLLTELEPFCAEIDISKLISNIDWPMGYTFIFDCEEGTLCKIIDCKGWTYNANKNDQFSRRPTITTKFWWESSGKFFYIVLSKSINLEQYQKSLKLSEGD